MLFDPLMPSMSLFDPFVEAVNRGVEVRFGAIDHRYTSVLVPSRGLIVVAPRLPDEWSRYAVAHQLMHIELDALNGLGGRFGHGCDRGADELVVCTATARTLMPVNHLRKALMESDQADDIAELLEVPTVVLARRMLELTPRERRALAPMVERVGGWPSSWDRGFVCGRFGSAGEYATIIERQARETARKALDDGGELAAAEP